MRLSPRASQPELALGQHLRLCDPQQRRQGRRRSGRAPSRPNPHDLGSSGAWRSSAARNRGDDRRVWVTRSSRHGVDRQRGDAARPAGSGSPGRRGAPTGQVAPRPARNPDPAGIGRVGQLSTWPSARRSAYIPFIYFAVSVGSLVVFARTGNFRLLLVVQLLDVLLMTTVGQMLAGGFLPSGGVGLWGILAPLGALVFLEVRVPSTGSKCSSSSSWPWASWARSSSPTQTSRAVHDHDAGVEHHRYRRCRLHRSRLIRQPAQRGADGAPGRAGRGPKLLLMNILPGSIAERLKAATGIDRRPLRLGLDPLRRHRRLHAARTAALAGRGRLDPRSAVLALRHARRAAWAREDQDDRRLLHGRGGRARSDAPITRAGPRSSRSTCEQRSRRRRSPASVWS